jgi:formiminoglutamase
VKHFIRYDKQDILNQTRLRRYETKLGEKIKVPDLESPLVETLNASPARFVLFGIPESIGVQANAGFAGTESAWPSFLNAFVNIQSGDRFTGEEVLMPGFFDFSPVIRVIDQHSKSPEEKMDACRHAVANIIDDEVEELVRMIVTAGKIPIAIGGGHNNSYPLIKGASKALHKTGKIPRPGINAVNVDAHADFRIMEGRHSGNGFRYAMEEGFLSKYAVVGLHENHNAQSMLDDLYSNVNIQYVFYEEIFMHERLNFVQALAQSFSFTDDNYTCVELDLDAIEGQLASAQSPSGISVQHARQYMNFAGNNQRIASVHICEGATRLSDSRESPMTGKLISFLVSDFVKSAMERG